VLSSFAARRVASVCLVDDEATQSRGARSFCEAGG
jgi:hypothetical protein